MRHFLIERDRRGLRSVQVYDNWNVAYHAFCNHERSILERERADRNPDGDEVLLLSAKSLSSCIATHGNWFDAPNPVMDELLNPPGSGPPPVPSEGSSANALDAASTSAAGTPGSSHEWTVFACVECGAIDAPADCPTGCGHCDGVRVVPAESLEALGLQLDEHRQRLREVRGERQDARRRVAQLSAALGNFLRWYDDRYPPGSGRGSPLPGLTLWRVAGDARAALDSERDIGEIAAIDTLMTRAAEAARKPTEEACDS